MEHLAMEIRRLVYTVICFRCMIHLTEGSVYQKYLKVFSYLLTMYICCNVIFSFTGQLENSFYEADELYSKWEEEWRDIIKTNNITHDIDRGKEFYKEQLWEDKIIGGAQGEYENQIENKTRKYETETKTEAGGKENGGEADGQTAEAD